LKNQYKKLIHRVLKDREPLTSRQIFDAIIDLPAMEEGGKPKRRATIPEYNVLVGMLSNPKYGCVRANGKYVYPALWKLKEE